MSISHKRAKFIIKQLTEKQARKTKRARAKKSPAPTKTDVGRFMSASSATDIIRRLNVGDTVYYVDNGYMEKSTIRMAAWMDGNKITRYPVVNPTMKHGGAIEINEQNLYAAVIKGRYCGVQYSELPKFILRRLTGWLRNGEIKTPPGYAIVKPPSEPTVEEYDPGDDTYWDHKDW